MEGDSLMRCSLSLCCVVLGTSILAPTELAADPLVLRDGGASDLAVTVLVRDGVSEVTALDELLQLDEAGGASLDVTPLGVLGSTLLLTEISVDYRPVVFETTIGGAALFFRLQLDEISYRAAGDAAETAGLPLTPVAALEGQVVASNLLNGNNARPDYAGVPTVAFTLPPIAAVGLREDEAREEGLNFRVNYQDTSGWYSSRRVGEEYSASKVLVEDGTGKILGAHLLGPAADELINFFALAIRRGLTAEDLKDVIYAYPTHASDLTYMV